MAKVLHGKILHQNQARIKGGARRGHGPGPTDIKQKWAPGE
jgi:hypothetical protein